MFYFGITQRKQIFNLSNHLRLAINFNISVLTFTAAKNTCKCEVFLSFNNRGGSGSNRGGEKTSGLYGQMNCDSSNTQGRRHHIPKHVSMHASNHINSENSILNK